MPFISAIKEDSKLSKNKIKILYDLTEDKSQLIPLLLRSQTAVNFFCQQDTDNYVSNILRKTPSFLDEIIEKSDSESLIKLAIENSIFRCERITSIKETLLKKMEELSSDDIYLLMTKIPEWKDDIIATLQNDETLLSKFRKFLLDIQRDQAIKIIGDGYKLLKPKSFDLWITPNSIKIDTGLKESDSQSSNNASFRP